MVKPPRIPEEAISLGAAQQLRHALPRRLGNSRPDFCGEVEQGINHESMMAEAATTEKADTKKRAEARFS